MNKTFLIITREYLTRIKKKSFIIMTIIGPVLFAALMIVPAWLAQMEDTEEKTIAVIDDSYSFTDIIPETKYIKFEYLKNTSVENSKKTFPESDYYAILYIPTNILNNAGQVQLFSNKQPSLGTKLHISNSLRDIIEKHKLKTYNLPDIDKILKSVKTKVNVQIIKWTESGEERRSNHEIAMGVGYISGFLIYMFIFMYGAMVMRGVIEEKTSRIVEVIISSVKPFQLMLGKIVGVGMVGLTQFLLWIILTFGIVTIVQTVVFPEIGNPTKKIETTNLLSESNLLQTETFSDEDMAEIENIFSSIKDIKFGVLFASFIFFFLGGFLLYASLFAAIGGAVDSEADTQQFMFPITIPLILGMVVMLNAIQNPEGQIAFWFSIIPFTSPIVMMVRIPFGVPYSELVLSAGLLILTFIGTTWFAGKIYRTGILMYGKKVTYKELWKWFRY
ncbi:MAG: ABC transporter permease [Bacteroidales bacterium]|nr:ABC transporter permease [Bacteroidales bacterium]